MTETEYLLLSAIRVLLKGEMEAGQAFRDVQVRVGDTEPGRQRDTDIEIAAVIARIDAALRKSHG